MIRFKEFMNEAKYEVEVEVRDASKANSIAKDMFRGLYKNNGSNSFVFKSQDDHDEFKDELSDMGIKLLESVEMNEAIQSSDLMRIKGLIKYAEKASKENNKVALNHFIQAIQTSGDSIESSKHAQMGIKAMKEK